MQCNIIIIIASIYDYLWRFASNYFYLLYKLILFKFIDLKKLKIYSKQIILSK